MLRNLPNGLSLFRILCVPLLLWLAWEGRMEVFLGVFVLALVSDVLDGLAARRLGLETELGAWLDQTADFALWVSFPLGAWWLWPEILRREAGWAVLSILCLLGPSAVAWLKYREIPGYHTWTAKTCAVLMGIGVPLLLVFDQAIPFRVAAVFMGVAAVDELGITWVLPTCRHDVPSVVHAMRMRDAADPEPKGGQA
ncbi:MAG: CDP-alcohol phosphatidyltransferase family protein [Myxococcota bacterium]